MARSINNQSWRWILINILQLLHVVGALRNVTIDDSDNAIVYRGGWSIATKDECYGGSCHFTTTDGATALYPLTGAVRLYFIGQILLDSTIKVVVDGTIITAAIADSPPQGVLWDSGMQFSPSKQYIIQVEKAGPSGTGREFYVDTFVKTVPDEGEVPDASSSNTNLVSTTTSSSNSPSSTVTGSTSSNLSTRSSTISGNTSDMSTLSGPSIPGNYNPSLSDSSSSSVASGSGSGRNGSSEMKPSTKAAIIGGTLGGLAFVCIIAGLFFYLGRGRRQSRRDSIGEEPSEPKPYDIGLNEIALPTNTTIGVIHGSSLSPLHLKEIRERQEAGLALSEASSSRSPPLEEQHRTPVVNRVSYHPSEWLSPTSQSQPWLMTNPPAYTVRPISGHVHAGGDTLSEFDGS